MMLSIAIQEAADGGYVISLGGDKTTGEAAQFAAARSELPEVMEWIADKAAKTFSASPYRPQPPQYMQTPQYRPEPPPAPRMPPEMPTVEPFDPPSFMEQKPEDPSLVHRIGKRMNGVAVIAFMVCLGAARMSIGA